MKSAIHKLFRGIFPRTIFLIFFLEIIPNLSFALGEWDGPTTGPVVQPLKTVVYIASDLKNGGVTAVYRGFESAANKLGWKIRYEDGKGNKVLQAKILSSAIMSHPDGIILSGFGADDFPELVATAKKTKIVLIGWHSSSEAGPTKDLFVNITTSAINVGNLAAKFIIEDAKSKNKKVGVIIFNDNLYAIANLKTKTMKKAIENCEGYKDCKVLTVKNVLISKADEVIPSIVPELIATYGNEWTYCLAINDAYYDSIHFPLLNGKRTDIILVSAGDGSERAIGRIEYGISEQKATIAEPLRMQGFQIADEFNRAFSGKKPSGYISKPLLLTKQSLKMAEELANNAKFDYEDAYSDIWKGKANKN